MFLLDTNVVSELRKVRAGKAHPHIVSWVSSVPSTSLYLSAIVVQELEIGILTVLRRDPIQGALLREWMTQNVLPSFEDRILPVDTAIALRSAALQVPDPRPIRDGLIAATALVHRLTVVTRNAADFEPTGVALFNPWTA